MWAAIRTCITMWSSGTGFSGVLGYGWYFLFTKAFKSSFAVACYVGNIIAIGFYLNFVYVLGKPTLRREVEEPSSSTGLPLVKSDEEGTIDIIENDENDSHNKSRAITNVSNDKKLQTRVIELTFRERMKHTLALWPFMVPLFVVYF